MTVKKQLQYFYEHGISMSFIAKQIGIEPSTLTKWLRDEKGITHKNEEKIYQYLLQLASDLKKVMEVQNER